MMKSCVTLRLKKGLHGALGSLGSKTSLNSPILSSMAVTKKVSSLKRTNCIWRNLKILSFWRSTTVGSLRWKTCQRCPNWLSWRCSITKSSLDSNTCSCIQSWCFWSLDTIKSPNLRFWYRCNIWKSFKISNFMKIRFAMRKVTGVLCFRYLSKLWVWTGEKKAT